MLQSGPSPFKGTQDNYEKFYKNTISTNNYQMESSFGHNKENDASPLRSKGYYVGLQGSKELSRALAGGHHYYDQKRRSYQGSALKAKELKREEFSGAKEN
mmetsp:Transcript_10396/g.10410  ORF Transcript_10396/g.10410 Transcript_10396/m.10410 type:complete len:101 (+) Transcript_10396:1831-2133(+)